MKTKCEPLAVRDGRLFLEDLAVEDLVAGLEGRAAWVISRTAVQAVSGKSRGARTVAMGDVGPLPVLAMLCVTDWWVRVHSTHELTLAEATGIRAERLVVSGRLKDDALIKDALVAGAAVIEPADALDRDNVARIAALLQRPVPAESGHPPDASAAALARCGALLAPALRGSPALGLDAAWEPSWRPAQPAAWPLVPGPAREGTLEGLSRSRPRARRTSVKACLHGSIRRGDWVAIPTPEAVRLHAADPVHPDPPVILVGGRSWRQLEHRPLPA